MSDPAAVYLPPSELRPWADNPRKNDQAVEAVADSIGRFGFGNPIVAWKPDDPLVIAGHTRLKASVQLGLEEVPVRFMPHLNLEQCKALAIADNKLNEIAEWDDPVLAAQLNELVEAEVDISGLGFSDKELRELAAGLEGDGDDFQPEEPPEDPVSKRGEVYELGPHRLMCGDSTSPEDWGTLMGSDRAALALTDPPYGVDLGYVDHDDTERAAMELADAWLPLAREHCDAVVFTPGVTGQWFYPRPDWVLCWFYGAGPGRGPWGFTVWQPLLAYGPDPSLASGNGCRPDAMQITVTFDDEERALSHPCPKPARVWSRLLEERLSFSADDLVVDPFTGSGTTLIACANVGRRFAGMEISPGYCDVIRTRWGEYAYKNGIDPGPDALLGVSRVG